MQEFSEVLPSFPFIKIPRKGRKYLLKGTISQDLQHAVGLRIVGSLRRSHQQILGVATLAIMAVLQHRNKTIQRIYKVFKGLRKHVRH